MNNTNLQKFDFIRPGILIKHEDKNYVVIKYIDLDSVLCKDLDTNLGVEISVKSIQLQINSSKEDLSKIKDENWEAALKRYEIIKPLISGVIIRTASNLKAHALAHEVSVQTLYNWINAYNRTNQVSSLIPKQRIDTGKNKISPEAREIIDLYIKNEYLTSQKPLASKVITKILMECRSKNIELPHSNTIRNIIDRIPDELRLRKRLGKQAVNTYKPIRGSFPGADWPMSVIQIDHSKLDIILVDDVYRKSIGRPWLTIAIDVYSRVIAGYYLSFDPPNSFSVGMCIANAILPKEQILLSHNVSGNWPVSGLMKTIHVDNGKDFRSVTFERSCAEYGIEILWRPVRIPHYGGTIERFFSTLEDYIHSIPGTTFSNNKDRTNYDSEAKAVLTISELENWLIPFIVGVYHQTEHSELGMAPIKKYEIGIVGDDNTLGRGISVKNYDEDRLRLDFMPFFERTIQAYGITFIGIAYYHDILRRWINACDPKNSKLKRKFIFKYDPRDLSVIFFYDPELKTYHRVPYRDTSHPIISIWELQNVKKHLSENKQPIDEQQIFVNYQKLNQIIQDATVKTKKIRRNTQVKMEHKKKIKPLLVQDNISIDIHENSTSAMNHGIDISLDNNDLKILDDIVE
ncbi:MAG TPA: Mu transposase C-terminal domain-containing protein [Aquella sp.]|nr:Mu transposase C-terminal domain-containing protein [Aquella sp.]